MASDSNLIRSMREISKRMVQTNYRKPWQFRVEMDEAPQGFDLYVKEISNQPYAIDPDQFKVGAFMFNYPESMQPVTLAMTCYDDEDERMYKWFEGRVKKVFNSDGTWNLPSEYLLTCKIYRRLKDGGEELRQHMRMVPTVLGDITESLDNHELLEFPLTFVEFRTQGIDY